MPGIERSRHCYRSGDCTDEQSVSSQGTSKFMFKKIFMGAAMFAITASLAATAKGEFDLESSDLEQRGSREIIELHQFFEGWYRGQEHLAFDRIDRALGADFVIVMPDARVLERAAIIEAVRGQHDSDALAKLKICNVALRAVHDGTAIFTYEEWQSGQDQPMRGRLSTVVFAEDPARPNGLAWLHVHETWLADNEAC
ncbi:MAG: hypothetical protein RQ741_00535 [Wenzhouxiangellaceae bacterium]|nr:hypothetical protein [Wenzhouxiangellaceae bacterium]